MNLSSKHDMSLRHVMFVILATVLIFCCKEKSNREQSVAEKKEPFDSLTQVQIKYANGFSVRYGDGFKEVEVYQPFEGSDDTLRYFLIPRESSAVPKGGWTLIETPIRFMVCLSTTHVALASFLDAENLIVGISGTQFIYDEKVRKLIAENKIAEIGNEESLDQEKILSLHPDIIMAYHTGIEGYDQYERLEESGLNVVINADFMETTPLGLCEWVKFLAVFTDQEKIANERFAVVEHEYNAMAKLASIPLKKPTVFTGVDWNGTWSVPGGRSFAANYLKDAGADYVWKKNPETGKLLLDFEQVYAEAADADFWINPGSISSWHELMEWDPRCGNFKAAQNRNLFSNDVRVNENGGFDYFESGVTHPQILLKDLIHIFHPELLPDNELVYYRQLP